MTASNPNVRQTPVDRFTKGGVVYRFARQSDEGMIQEVLRDNPMASWVSLSTEHEPSYFASTELFGERRAVVAVREDDGAPVGMGSYVVMPVHVNGEAVSGGYLCELRVLPEYRHRMRVVRNAYIGLQVLSEAAGDTPQWYTSIASENAPAKRLLEANLRGMPAYHAQGEMVTRALAARAGRAPNVMRRADVADLPALAAFYNEHASRSQYAPALSESWLRALDGRHGLNVEDFWVFEDGGALRACFAVWDQQAVKQTVVRGYRFPLSAVRSVYNGYARLTGRVSLPPVGGRIRYAFIAFLAIDDAADVGSQVIDAALALVKARGLPLAMLGLRAGHPLEATLARMRQETYRTDIYSVVWPGQEATAAMLDARPVQPEIALL